MSNLNTVRKQLQQEHSRVSAELERINHALAALNSKNLPRKRKLSASAIARIRAAQRARWAKWRKANKSSS